MARLGLSWLRYRLDGKRARAADLDGRRTSGSECGHWGLVDTMMRGTEARVR